MAASRKSIALGSDYVGGSYLSEGMDDAGDVHAFRKGAVNPTDTNAGAPLRV